MIRIAGVEYDVGIKEATKIALRLGADLMFVDGKKYAWSREERRFKYVGPVGR